MSDDKIDILIVDDLPEKVLVYRAILEELGENLVIARSGPEALEHVLKREFAVILLDVNMPDMDGLETARLPVPVLADVAALALAQPATAGARAILVRSIDGEVTMEGDAELPHHLAAVVARAFAEGVAAFDPAPAEGADPAPVAVAL